MSESIAPHFSDDGRWWWDGSDWIPVPPRPAGLPESTQPSAALRTSASPLEDAPLPRGIGVNQTFGRGSDISSDGERDLMVAGLHPLSTAYSMVIVLAVFIVAALFSGSSSFFAFAVMVSAVIGIPAVISARVKLATTRMAVTTRRVILTRGILVKKQDTVLLAKVEGVSIEQSILGRYFGFGAIQITGTGGSTTVLAGVRDPQAVRDAVNAQVASLIRR